MPKIIDPSVKSQIIKMHLEGKGRNKIAESLKHQVSSGTVSAVLKHYREQPESFNKSNARVTTFPEEGLSEIEFHEDQTQLLCDLKKDFLEEIGPRLSCHQKLH